MLKITTPVNSAEQAQLASTQDFLSEIWSPSFILMAAKGWEEKVICIKGVGENQR